MSKLLMHSLREKTITNATYLANFVEGKQLESLSSKLLSQKLNCKLEYSLFLEKKLTLLSYMNLQNYSVSEEIKNLKTLYMLREREIDLIDLKKTQRNASYNYSDFLRNSSLAAVVNPVINIIIAKLALLYGTQSLDSRIFVSPESYVQNTHFDWRAKNNLLIQLHGEKKIFLYRPDNLKVKRGLLNTTRDYSYKLEENFLLKPGDALLIPPFFWHRTEAKSFSISTSIRFGQSALDPIFQYIPPDWRLNKILTRMYNNNSALPKYIMDDIFSVSNSTELERIYDKIGDSITQMDIDFDRDHSKDENLLRYSNLFIKTLIKEGKFAHNL